MRQKKSKAQIIDALHAYGLISREVAAKAKLVNHGQDPIDALLEWGEISENVAEAARAGEAGATQKEARALAKVALSQTRQTHEELAVFVEKLKNSV